MKKLLPIYLGITLQLVAVLHASSIGLTNQDLNSNWTFRAHNETTFRNATVPGTVHLDLMKHGVIEDPFYRDNANKLNWIEHTTFHYQTEFDAEPSVLNQEKIEIVFEGLDTHATVTLNGQNILEADNMFRTWIVDVKQYLKSTGNLLEVAFHSAVEHDSLERSKIQGMNLYLPSDFDSGRVFSRKAAYQYGWDWGTRLVTCGVWRPVYLRAWSQVKISQVHLKQHEVTSEVANIEADLELAVNKDVEYRIKVVNSETNEIYFDNTTILNSPNSSNSTTTQFSANFQIQNPKLWWVRNLGTPYLYPLKIQILDTDTILHELVINLGIRTIELIQEPDDIGKSFYFKINGVRVFAKGGNYIPPDSFMPRMTRAGYEAVLKHAVDANYNFIRIWGGGNYEDNIFYEICDREGILLWHDFMFANGMYPGTDTFLDNIKQEIIDNVVRLRNHPSIALWCGNNEILNGWQDWGYPGGMNNEQRNMVFGWYEKIFHTIIPSVLNETDGSRPYWPTSPLFGFGHYQSYTMGDSHYYGVWVSNEPFENYAQYVGRFMSEYGIQGLPCMNTVKKFTKPEDVDRYSQVIQSHEKGPAAYYHIDNYLEHYYKPINQSFETYLYASQIMQKLGIQEAIEAHRNAKPRNMGTLMWQLNDNWPSFSWSAVDYYGTWKAVQYMTKKRFQDVIVAITHSFGVQIVSEKLFDFEGQLTVAIKTLNGTVLQNTTMNVTVPKDSSQKYFDVPYSKIPGLNKSNTYIEATITYPFDEKFSTTTAFFVKPKNVELENPNIVITANLNENKLTVQSDTLLVGTYLYIDGIDLHFDDNYFELVPNEPKTIQLLNTNLTNITDLPNKLEVYHLYKTYSPNVNIPNIKLFTNKTDVPQQENPTDPEPTTETPPTPTPNPNPTETGTNTPTEPEAPSTPTNPETPTTPTEPETPSTPTIPTEPETPATPTTPTEPERPADPVIPPRPTKPTTPTKETPSKPSNPEKPTTTTKDPEAPTTSPAPTELGTPTKPGDPETPVTPVPDGGSLTNIKIAPEPDNGFPWFNYYLYIHVGVCTLYVLFCLYRAKRRNVSIKTFRSNILVVIFLGPLGLIVLPYINKTLEVAQDGQKLVKPSADISRDEDKLEI